ncbi:Protein phosphatase Slingshot 3, variant 2 [Balamuthia mandrillaris]
MKRSIGERIQAAQRPTRVVEGLYLGNEWNAIDRELLIELDVSAVVNAAWPNVRNHFEADEGFKYLWLEVYEDPKEDIAQHFDPSVDFIEEALKEGRTSLVHSKSGNSRATSLCVAYLMRSRGWPLFNALLHIKRLRASAQPNDGFLQQLILFERVLQERNERREVNEEEDEEEDEQEEEENKRDDEAEEEGKGKEKEKEQEEEEGESEMKTKNGSESAMSLTGTILSLQGSALLQHIASLFRSSQWSVLGQLYKQIPSLHPQLRRCLYVHTKEHSISASSAFMNDLSNNSTSSLLSKTKTLVENLYQWMKDYYELVDSTFPEGKERGFHRALRQALPHFVNPFVKHIAFYCHFAIKTTSHQRFKERKERDAALASAFSSYDIASFLLQHTRGNAIVDFEGYYCALLAKRLLWLIAKQEDTKQTSSATAQKKLQLVFKLEQQCLERFKVGKKVENKKSNNIQQNNTLPLFNMFYKNAREMLTDAHASSLSWTKAWKELLAAGTIVVPTPTTTLNKEDGEEGEEKLPSISARILNMRMWPYQSILRREPEESETEDEQSWQTILPRGWKMNQRQLPTGCTLPNAVQHAWNSFADTFKQKRPGRSLHYLPHMGTAQIKAETGSGSVFITVTYVILHEVIPFACCCHSNFLLTL